jgi:hypothetical protein
MNSIGKRNEDNSLSVDPVSRGDIYEDFSLLWHRTMYSRLNRPTFQRRKLAHRHDDGGSTHLETPVPQK